MGHMNEMDLERQELREAVIKHEKDTDLIAALDELGWIYPTDASLILHDMDRFQSEITRLRAEVTRLRGMSSGTPTDTNKEN